VTAGERRGPDCERHRTRLIAVAASAGTARAAAAGRDDPAAARHLDECATCRRVAQELALLSFAVQRAWGPAQDIEPPDDAWPRLRERVSRRPVQLGRAASSVAGLALGAALTIGLLAPIGLSGGARLGANPRAILSETGFAPSTPGLVGTPEDLDERKWLLRQSREPLVLQGGSDGPSGVPFIGLIQEAHGPVPPRREQMRYAEDEHPSVVPAPAVPSLTVL